MLRCIWDGLDTKAISQRLNVSTKGIDYHRQNIMKMWECQNILQVIRLALRRGILEEFPLTSLRGCGGPTRERRRAYVLVNNRSEGNASLTVQALVDQMKQVSV